MRSPPGDPKTELQAKDRENGGTEGQDDFAESGSKRKRGPTRELEELDPVHRQLATFCVPNVQVPNDLDPAAAQRIERVRVANMDEVFNALVRRVGWTTGADRRCNALRIEIGSGELEGCALFISAETSELRIELDAPPGVDVEVWKNRLSRRLASHGLRASLI
jgi:hypothetical protein